MLSCITWYSSLSIYLSLSTAVDATPHVIVTITVPDTTIFYVTCIYPLQSILDPLYLTVK